MAQIFNFSSGPAMLPAEVLKQAQQELRDWNGLGTSVMEVSHRGKEFIQVAEEAGIWISFDPNLRKSLWESEELAKEQIRYGLNHCHILKISDNEIQFISGKEDYDEVIDYAINLGISNCYCQLEDTNSKKYIPDFNLEGVNKS